MTKDKHPTGYCSVKILRPCKDSLRDTSRGLMGVRKLGSGSPVRCLSFILYPHFNLLSLFTFTSR